MDKESFWDVVKNRRSVRRFKPDPVPDEYVKKMLDMARWAMSGANGQPWEFVVVKDAKTKQQISDIMMEHAHRTTNIELTRIEELRLPRAAAPRTSAPGYRDAPVIIVVCGDPRTFQATVLAAHFYSGDWDTFHVNMGNATQLICLAASALGLGSQWVSLALAPEWKIKALLGIPDFFRVRHMVPIGFPAYKPLPPFRREVEEIVHLERYDSSRFRSDEDIKQFIINLRKWDKP